MSSRAAASRKRITNSEEKEKRPSSTKSFFSRSKNKSSASPPSPLNFPPSVPPAPFSQDGRHGSPQRSPYHSEVELVTPDRHHARRNSANADRLRDTSFHIPNSNGVRKMSSATMAVSTRGYPSPPIEEFQAIRLSPYQSHEDAYGIGQPKVSYIEASYQPPPPIQASYQPPPPVQSTPVNGQRNLPNLPGKNTAHLSSFRYPEPPSYPPSVPTSTITIPVSPATSPGPSSVSHPAPSSRNHSPTPTLPTYSSSQLPYGSSHINRPNLQVSIHNSPLSSNIREEYAQYNDVHAYPSPPPSQSARLGPSPVHIPISLRPESTTSSIDMERRPWNRGTGSYSPITSPQPQAGMQVFPPQSTLLAPSSRFGPPSISGSSDSSGQSSSKKSTGAPPGGFVFPGSRSTARPKVSKKTNSPVIKVKSKGKTRSQKGSDGEAHSPLPVPDIHSLPPPPPLQEQRTSSPVSHLSGNTRPVVMTWRDDSVFEASSSFSDDSDQPRLRKSTKGSDTSSNSGKPAPITQTDGSPTAYVFPGSRSRAHPSKPPISVRRSRKTSSNTDDGSVAERSKFMGILLKKKKKKYKDAESSIGTSTMSSGSELDTDSTRSPPSSSYSQSVHQEPPPPVEDYQENLHQDHNMERAARIKSRIGQYPLDPYDSVLLDNDRHTGELLMRLNPTNSPSFHNYGNNPPTSVLDLGCGQGHWVVDAAIAWKGYGTRVTGYDMVDISRGLLPWAVEQGVADNIRFVRGNFLKQRLPFNDESFDLVRMSCLALCITTDSWIFVLQEVCRVLMVGGRLELIDDFIFFPYGKVSSPFDGPNLEPESDVISVAPRLDITIPSSSFTTFSIYDGETTNPGLGAPADGPEAEDFYELYGVDEEEELDTEDDAATINEFNANSDQRISPNPTTNNRRRTLARAGLSSPLWARAQGTSSDLEALFEHMLQHKFGISKDPSEFIMDLMKEVFGHAQELKTMHITLAPPEFEGDGALSGQSRQNGGFNGANGFTNRRFGMSHTSRRESMALPKTPGLVLLPSTFIPMEQSEIEIHASKHLRMLLSCKNYLIEHAVEATDDEEIDDASVLEALWEYEGFLRHRFNPPPPSSPSPNSDLGSDAVSVRGSIAESVCSDNREYMWELQSEFGQRFAWQRSGSSDRSSTPGTLKERENTPTTPTLPTPLSPNAPSVSSSNATAGSGLNNDENRTLSTTPTAPMYSRDEMTHVRTFRVYEAIKIDENLFGSAM
ncbi:hypothetical protein JR316_0008425 [Psilocybe cubensis]|uniref:Methyltransferase domain-containing protein n=2 Tax=Psilocybe cubensis TaxID=181762 RepID=A0A8H8CHS5_PSICU|nr:hypothetical protein JR316_0008425 [Psilocybe cubensis]KAH9479830.1 hypothetical protein JR316_0008425 [Psilocybe cubensis]